MGFYRSDNGKELKLQTKSRSHIPYPEDIDILPDSGYDGLSKVTLTATDMSGMYNRLIAGTSSTNSIKNLFSNGSFRYYGGIRCKIYYRGSSGCSLSTQNNMIAFEVPSKASEYVGMVFSNAIPITSTNRLIVIGNINGVSLASQASNDGGWHYINSQNSEYYSIYYNHADISDWALQYVITYIKVNDIIMSVYDIPLMEFKNRLNSSASNSLYLVLYDREYSYAVTRYVTYVGIIN